VTVGAGAPGSAAGATRKAWPTIDLACANVQE